MVAQPISQPQVAPGRHQRLEAIMYKAGEIMLNYWALAITIVLGLIVGAALSVPLLTYLGLNDLAKPLFFTLHLICAQIPSHSFYILGHQLGMCARNMGIYTSMFLGGLVFVLSKKRLPGIPWWFWLLLILPMAYDGLTQMFGWRESTWELRVITGTLFGFGNMWFALPFIQRTVTQTLAEPGPLQKAALVMPPLAPVFISQLDLETPFPSTETSVPVSQPENVSQAQLRSVLPIVRVEVSGPLASEEE